MKTFAIANNSALQKYYISIFKIDLRWFLLFLKSLWSKLWKFFKIAG
jgi:hypothetical protein